MSGGSDTADGVERNATPRVGTYVDVWNKFLGRWSGPFEVVASSGDGCRVRRPGDQEPLPETFLPAEVTAVGAPRSAP
jgi:hypothetical protein